MFSPSSRPDDSCLATRRLARREGRRTAPSYIPPVEPPFRRLSRLVVVSASAQAGRRVAALAETPSEAIIARPQLARDGLFGTRVKALSSPGEGFGELSVVSNNPRSNTILATCDTLVVKVGGSRYVSRRARRGVDGLIGRIGRARAPLRS